MNPVKTYTYKDALSDGVSLPGSVPTCTVMHAGYASLDAEHHTLVRGPSHDDGYDSFEDDTFDGYVPTPPKPQHTIVYPWATFPHEIFDLIMDAVADDTDEEYILTLETLRTCTLVSKAWRTHVQPYLFRDVVITSVPDLLEFRALLDAYPRIARTVERLLICVQCKPDTRGGLRFDAPQSAIGLFPSLIQGRLPQLFSLRIEVLDFGDSSRTRLSRPAPRVGKETICLPPRFSEHLSTFMPTITSLHLQSMQFPCFSDYIRMLWALPNVTDLYCANLRWSAPGVLPACMHDKDKVRLHRRRRFLPRLRHLTVRVLLSMRLELDSS